MIHIIHIIWYTLYIWYTYYTHDIHIIHMIYIYSIWSNHRSIISIVFLMNNKSTSCAMPRQHLREALRVQLPRPPPGWRNQDLRNKLAETHGKTHGKPRKKRRTHREIPWNDGSPRIEENRHQTNPMIVDNTGKTMKEAEKNKH